MYYCLYFSCLCVCSFTGEILTHSNIVVTFYRACGQIFCNDCTKGRMTLPNFGYDEDVRVCDRCYQKHNELTEETRDSE